MPYWYCLAIPSPASQKISPCFFPEQQKQHRLVCFKAAVPGFSSETCWICLQLISSSQQTFHTSPFLTCTLLYARFATWSRVYRHGNSNHFQKRRLSHFFSEIAAFIFTKYKEKWLIKGPELERVELRRYNSEGPSVSVAQVLDLHKRGFCFILSFIFAWF